MEVTLADWKCAHLRCHFPLHGALRLLLVLMAVLGAAPLSTWRAGPCSWPSPLPAPRDWGYLLTHCLPSPFSHYKTLPLWFWLPCAGWRALLSIPQVAWGCHL